MSDYKKWKGIPNESVASPSGCSLSAFDALKKHIEQRRKANPDVIHHIDTTEPPGLNQPWWPTLIANYKAWRAHR
ncbi:MAG: hypothetical protein KAJ55_00225 [Anaerolineales bacterium]|nr:hypothetical protein [Anaerolineales bacterium]